MFCQWMRLSVLLALLATCAPAEGQIGSRGPVRRKVVPVQVFDELAVYAAFNVFYTPSEKPSLTIEATEELLQFVEVSEENSRLLVSVKADVRTLSRFNLFVSGPSLRVLELVGDGAFQATSTWRADSISVVCQGSVGVTATVDAKVLSVLWSGTGRWALNGSAHTQRFRLSGATDFDASGLDGRSIKLWALGAGNVSLGKLDLLDLVAAGQVNLTHRGSPSSYRLLRPRHLSELNPEE